MSFVFNTFANLGNVTVSPPPGVVAAGALLDQNFANAALLINSTNYPVGSTSALQLAAIATANGAANTALTNTSVFTTFGLGLVAEPNAAAVVSLIGAAKSDLSNVSYLTAFGISLISTSNATIALGVLGASNTSLTNTTANQVTTNQIFTQNGSKPQRMNDTLDVGGATVNSRDFPLTTNDWLGTFENSIGANPNIISTAMMGVLNSQATSAGGAIVAGVQSQYLSSGADALASQSYLVLNHASGSIDGWGHYIETHRLVGASGTLIALEVDTRTLITSISPTPYVAGDVYGIQIASGAGASSSGQFDASAAIDVAGNPMRFKVGLNIRADSITSGGIGIAMPINVAMQFFNPSGFQCGAVVSSATGNNPYVLDFTDSGAQFAGGVTSAAIAYFVTVANAVNWLNIVNAPTGSGPVLGAQGSDTNVNLILSPKGTGLVQFDNASSFTANGAVATALSSIGPTGSHTTVQEWMTVLNPSGITRYIPCF